MGLSVESRCLAYHGPLLYEAKVLKVHEKNKDTVKVKDGTEAVDPETFPLEFKDRHLYFIHYRGWKSSWDEWVQDDRVLAYDEENLKKQKELKAALAKANQPPPKEKKEKEKKEPVTRRTKKPKEEASLESEDEFLRRPEIAMTIPDNLKSLLVDDWELVTKEKQLVRLPAKTSVKQILDEYGEIALKGKAVHSADYDNTVEIVKGLNLYFDRCLGSILLYQLERRQLLDVQTYPVNAGKTPSEIYGVEHLLRLLVTLPGLIAQTSMDQQSISLMREFVEKLLRWLDEKAKSNELFVKDYENVSPAYEALSRS
ncbi:unnamed protein product [Kuraishia capsulata CBS 1993]|uniref:Chromatin modification-related protein EAF3 n=1 Tax=Kuraishia capsulata CBS 1993 TaxID=1382522 RepID=W6MLG5_9ASCO|nr:uncharacterized protein KUCA_T00003327001 [Kuraishia capsulata CBS 1993]CDK27349.1 unnamed protein product [Kuraishia capsulata CBS 1993]